MIDPKLSARYGIVSFGRVGMQILHGGKMVRIFNDRTKTPAENWADALKYAREREREKVTA